MKEERYFAIQYSGELGAYLEGAEHRLVCRPMQALRFVSYASASRYIDMHDDIRRDGGHVVELHVSIRPAGQGLAGDELKRLRLLAGFTQKDVADARGVTHATVSKWERGVARVPDRHVGAIRRLLEA